MSLWTLLRIVMRRLCVVFLEYADNMPRCTRSKAPSACCIVISLRTCRVLRIFCLDGRLTLETIGDQVTCFCRPISLVTRIFFLFSTCARTEWSSDTVVGRRCDAGFERFA